MTECPKCKGYGIVGGAVPDILRGRGAIFSSNECDMCHGSGEVQMTNEEWFCTLSTEEKAEVLRDMIITDSYGFLDKIEYEEDWGCNGARVIEGWLKEIHK